MTGNANDRRLRDEPLLHVAVVVTVLVAAAWVAVTAGLALLTFFIAVVAATVLNAPVRWIEAHGVPRGIAALLVLAAIVLAVAVATWLVVPRILDQSAALAQNAPEYVAGLEERTDRFIGEHPALDRAIELDPDRAAEAMPSGLSLLARVGRYSVGVLMFVVLTFAVIAMTVYMLLDPRPLLQGALRATPEAQRQPLERSLSRASDMLVAWVRATVVVGAMEGVLVAVFLSLIGLPGALVWAALAFFAELVPKLGAYLMAIPPLLVTLATDPGMTPWVVLFYVVMNEIMGDFVTPWLQGDAMDVHPVLLLLAVLVFGSTFGLLGALLATPLMAFVVAFVHEFHVSRQEPVQSVDGRVDAILERQAHA